MFLVKKVRLIVVLTMIPITLVACEPRQTETVVESQPETVVEPEMPVIEPEGPIYILNPAEIYCIGLGYEYTTRERKIDKQEPQLNPHLKHSRVPILVFPLYQTISLRSCVSSRMGMGVRSGSL